MFDEDLTLRAMTVDEIADVMANREAMRQLQRTVAGLHFFPVNPELI